MLKNLSLYSRISPVILSLMLSGPALSASQFEDIESSFNDEDLLFSDIPSVFSASKYEQKVTEAPARISVITADEIQRYGHRSLIDILNTVPGFQSSYDRSYSRIGSRGFNIPGDFNSRILLLIDGHRTNENIYDGMLADQAQLVNIDLIDRVEIVRGPASSLYGSSAFFGVINVITKRGRDFQGAEAALEAGSLDSQQKRFSYGNRFANGVEVLLSASEYESNGHDRLYYAEFDDPDTNNGYADNADDSDQHSFFGKLSFGNFTMTGIYAEQEKATPTGSYGTVFNDSRTRSWEGHAYVDLKYQNLFDNGADVTARLFYDDYWYKGDFVYDYADPGDPPDIVVNKDGADGDWWGVESQVTQQWFDNHRTTLGMEYRESLKEEQYNYDVYGSYLDIDTDEYTWAAYLQDEFRVSNNLILSLGLRHDYYSNSKGSTNPRVAAIWTPYQSTTLKFIYGSAFRAPNAYELHYEDGGESHKAPHFLDPETIDTYEVILAQELSKELRLVTSIYHNEIKDLIAVVTDPGDGLLVFTNTGKASGEGAEVELIAQRGDGWSGSVSYAFQQAENAMGERLSNSPQHLAKLNLIAPLAGDDFSAGLTFQYEDGRKTLGGNETDARFITNLTLFNKNWIEGLKLSASIYNLFDERYANPGFEEHTQDKIEQDGRILRFKFAYAF